MKHIHLSLLFLLLSLSATIPSPLLATNTIQSKEQAQSLAWFDYANNDLRAAQVLATIDNPLFGVALYHIEQAVEKALKAYLIFCGQKFALVHDLPPLLNACQKCDTGFQQFQADIKEINPYSTKSRYPNKSFTMPDRSTVLKLVNKADQFLNFVRKKMDSIL